ncbi:MAG: YdbL family protein [Kangiellaceae bacterium]|nr:YdbL family protein [Kangiellaceae bacterium]
MKQLSKYLVIITLLFTGQVMAANLTSAKSSGFIGEQANGYIGLVKASPKDITALVKEVNAKRKSRYKKIAASQALALNNVEKIGGEKAMKKTKPGNYVKPAGKGWMKKK